MRVIRFATVFLTLVLAVQVSAQTSQVLSNYLVSPKTDQVMQKVADRFEVQRKTAYGYEVIVPASRAKELLQLVPTAKLLQADIKDEIRATDLAGYHNFSQVEAQLNAWAASHADLCSLSTYGKTKQGRPLYALTVADSSVKANKPEIMITSATHGDELITVEVVLGIMKRLIEGYATEPRIRDIVANHVIHFIPVVNADGFNSQDRYDNGVDPNRSYPWPESQNNPSSSIAPLMKFFNERNIVASIDFHAYGELVMYPWAYTYSTVPSADEEVFDTITKKMASFNGYTAGQISKVIYVAKGSSADYFYWKKKSISLGIEMANSKVPSASQIPNILADNMESTLYFLESFK